MRKFIKIEPVVKNWGARDHENLKPGSETGAANRMRRCRSGGARRACDGKARFKPAFFRTAHLVLGVGYGLQLQLGRPPRAQACHQSPWACKLLVQVWNARQQALFPPSPYNAFDLSDALVMSLQDLWLRTNLVQFELVEHTNKQLNSKVKPFIEEQTDHRPLRCVLGYV